MVVALTLHDLGLDDQISIDHMRHHEINRVDAERSAQAQVLTGDVGFGAVGCDAQARDAAVDRHLQVIDRADAGQRQRRHLGSFEARTAQILFVAVGGEAIIDRCAAEAVSVRHLDQRDPA